MSRILCWGYADRLFAERGSFLHREDCEVLLASASKEVLKLARRAHPDAVLLDRECAGAELTSLCDGLKSNRHTAGIPIVLIVSGSDEAQDPALAGLDLHAIVPRSNQHQISQSLARALGAAARKHPRFAIEAPAEVRRGDDNPIPSRALDISLEGIQLEIDHPLQLGCEISVTLNLPVDPQPLSLRATVVRIHADPIWGRNRLGLRFRSLDAPTRAQLNLLLGRLAEVESKLVPPPEEPQQRYFF